MTSRADALTPAFMRDHAWKRPVRAATTAAGTLASSFENGDTIDGVVLATGDRILIKDQASGSANGIYVVAASGAPARAEDMDTGLEALGCLVKVTNGTINGGKFFTCTTTGTITVGSTSIAFAEIGASPVTAFAVPTIALGTAAAAGSATTAVRSDATIAAFDATVPASVAGVGVASSTGSAAFAARRDHGHALTYHDEPLTDGASNFIFAGGDIVVVIGVPNP